MDNSPTTRHLQVATSITPRRANIRFRKTNFDGTKLPIAVVPDHTTTGGMNLPLRNFCSLSRREEVRGEVAIHVRSIDPALLCYCEIEPKEREEIMPATSAIVDQLIDGQGFVLIPNLIDASDAAQARSRALEVAASPSGAAFGKLNEKIRQQHVRGLLAHDEIFERLVQHPALIEIAEAMLGDDMTLGAYSARILHPGAIEMGVHIDYPY